MGVVASFRIRAITLAILVGISAGVIASAESDRFAQAAPSTGPSSYALDEGDAVVTGAVAAAGAWVVARDSAPTPQLHLYHFESTGTHTRSDLELADAGIQAAVAVDRDGNVWVGAGRRLVRFDPITGSRHTTTLPKPGAAVSTATRSPDGVVMGWGNVVGMTPGPSGELYVARYAVPALTRVDGCGEQGNHDGSHQNDDKDCKKGSSISELPLRANADPAKLVLVGNAIWFTVEHAPDGRLANALGILDLTTGAAAFVSGEARDLVARDDGIHMIGSVRQRVDPQSLQLTPESNPPGLFDFSIGTYDAGGNFVVRTAKRAQLTYVDPNGQVLRTVAYSTGTFTDSSGQARTLASRLAFAGLDAGGGVWWAPTGGRSVFRVV